MRGVMPYGPNQSENISVDTRQLINVVWAWRTDRIPDLPKSSDLQHPALDEPSKRWMSRCDHIWRYMHDPYLLVCRAIYLISSCIESIITKCSPSRILVIRDDRASVLRTTVVHLADRSRVHKILSLLFVTLRVYSRSNKHDMFRS